MSYIGIREVTRRYIGGTLVWEKDIPPMGRIIPVGSGSGDLTVDGTNLVYESNPTTIQDGDTIVIQAGTYGNIDFLNLELDDGDSATVTSNGVVTYTTRTRIRNNISNIWFNFGENEGLQLSNNSVQLQWLLSVR